MAHGLPRIVGLLGYPVRHSASPAMHRAAFRALRMAAWAYLLFEVPPERLELAVAGLRGLGFAGANVTIPHKRAVLRWMDDLSEEARATGAVNTIVADPAQGRLSGHNTDVAGVILALRAWGVEAGERRVLVLGAGGAARAAVYACLRAGSPWVGVCARRPERAAALVEELGATEAFPLDGSLAGTLARRGVDLVIQATPAGMENAGEEGDAAGERLAGLVAPERLPRSAAILEMVYRPPVTPLVRAARSAGLAVVPGAAMLLYQGAQAFALWTGQDAPVDAMARALARELRVPAQEVLPPHPPHP
ncbi:shikimate dehydrogenase [Carboxydochorda subterranea]|uniref:Shikimate dehydrogenase (NADP(+)) n=1 Tax=Carboxydichorda subterranea TaxID=3109565 RepID=A0ABZ1BWN0_9FIRM|nr:shikimate dehydrogenase [Limnochorda sp. L945t]WRP17078.1 shikimate dehydrogenase [Limnochorda sp. L945t]